MPSDGLLSSSGWIDVALLSAGVLITVVLAIGFVILMRNMGREPK
jgi:hypothetical protein